MYQRYDLRQNHRAEPHHLNPQNRTVIDPSPIWTPHQEQLINNRVVPMGDIVVLPFLEGVNGVRPVTTR